MESAPPPLMGSICNWVKHSDNCSISLKISHKVNKEYKETKEIYSLSLCILCSLRVKCFPYNDFSIASGISISCSYWFQ